MEGEKHDRLAKILLIGDSGVGKTCFLMRFIEDSHNIDHLPTVGIDFKLKTVDVKNQKVKLQLWDTAGQDKFHTLTATYFKGRKCLPPGAHGILLLYSITDKKTFKNVDNWIQQVREKSPENVSIMLVGNKTDLVHDRAVDYEEGKKLAETYGASFVEASAYDGANVEQAFLKLTEQIVTKKGGVPAEDGGMKDKLMNSRPGKQISKKCCKT